MMLIDGDADLTKKLITEAKKRKDKASSSNSTKNEQAGKTTKQIDDEEKRAMEIRAARSEKRINDEAYQLLIDYYGGVERMAENAVLFMNSEAIREFIEIQLTNRQKQVLNNRQRAYEDANTVKVNDNGSIRPATAMPDFLIDLESSGSSYSPFQTAKRLKGLSTEDMRLLISYYKGDETKTRNAVINESKYSLDKKIATMRAFSDHAGDELSGGSDSSSGSSSDWMSSFDNKVELYNGWSDANSAN